MSNRAADTTLSIYWTTLCIICILGVSLLMVLALIVASPFLLLAWLAGGCE